MLTLFREVSALDWAALMWFVACWAGYGFYADRGTHAARGLIGVSHGLRLQWSRQLLARENRISDAALVGNLMNTVSFYANTTIYIIAGLMAVLGALDQVIDVTSDLPFARRASRELWELKLVVLLGVFVVAYFKFTWSIRQFNLMSILIGAAPPRDQPQPGYAEKLATVNSYAGDEFNRGIRAYYFGLAAMAWIVHPLLFIGLAAFIIVVLYRRDFASPVLAALRTGSDGA